MKTIGSHPGASLFRLSLMIIIVAILVVIFFRYVDDAQLEIERQSVLQTKRIIDSTLAVVFARYAVNGRLDDLNQLRGGNPFAFLEDYQLLPASYVGELDGDLTNDQAPGWYYLRNRELVVYKSRFRDVDRYFSIILNFRDIDQNGKFESGHDQFTSLQFVRQKRR